MPTTAPTARDRRRVLLIGAGLAGCAVAAALARRGARIEMLAAPEVSGSDVPVAVLAPPPLAGNDPVTAWRRRGAVVTASWCRWIERHLGDSGRLGTGVLLLPSRERDRRRFARLPTRGGGPVRLAPAAAAALSGAWPGRDCAYHPDGGWYDPPALRQALLRWAGVDAAATATVTTLARVAGQWVARDRDGVRLGAAPVCVLAAGMGSAALVPALGSRLIPARGQASAIAAPALRIAVSGGGYAAPDGGGRVWLGATVGRGDADRGIRPGERDHNLAIGRRLWPGAAMPAVVDDFAAVRATTRDRLPLVGTIGEDLWLSAGHGTQGLASTPLAAMLLAEAIRGHRRHPLLQRLAPDRRALGGLT